MLSISPTLALIISSFVIVFISILSTRKKSKYFRLISLLVGIAFYLLLNDFVVKKQAELIVHDVFDFKQKKDIVPKTLNEIYDNNLMTFTPSFDKYVYERQNETKESYQWKLEFKNIWGTEYFYDDKTGDIEKRKNWQGDNHWNEFSKTK